MIVPCFLASRHGEDVLRSMPETIDRIIVVDDGCSQGSGDIALKVKALDDRINVIRHQENRAVGAAVTTGYGKAMEVG